MGAVINQPQAIDFANAGITLRRQKRKEGS
jgi:hypothetical protein